MVMMRSAIAASIGSRMRPPSSARLPASSIGPTVGPLPRLFTLSFGRSLGTWPKIKPKRIRVITMDVTGTLVSFRGSLSQHYLGSAAKVGVELPPQAQFDRAFKQAYTEISRRYPCFGSDRISAKEWWRHCVLRSFELAGAADMSDHQADLLFQRIYSVFGSLAAYEKFDDAVPFLRWAQRSGVVCGVLSNADERYGDSILPMLGLTHDELQFQCFSKDYGLEKPHAQFYLAAMQRAELFLRSSPFLQQQQRQQQQQQRRPDPPPPPRLDPPSPSSRNVIYDDEDDDDEEDDNDHVTNSRYSSANSDDDDDDPLLPAQVLHVGNDYTKDFEGARRAGMHAVLLNRYHEEELAQEWKRRGALVFEDLIDVVEFLGRSHCQMG